jgi:Fe-S cluster biosynthesis and repair protein YggX
MDDARIEQFRKMAEADPENELGHFSLGRALIDAGRFAEAVPSLQRSIQLNAQNSRAYQLLGLAQKQVGDRAGAVRTLRRGFEVAHARGDLMPRNEIGSLLKELGEAPPELTPAPSASAQPAAAEPGVGEIQCRRCGRLQPRMAQRPFKGQLGEQVWAGVCQSCWGEWVRMGTKVINELRLNFADPRHAEMYDQHMKEFLNLQ